MKALSQLINSYSIKYDYKLKSICTSLADHLKIPVFTYYQIDTKGNFCFLSNFPEQAEYYYSEKMYLTNPYLVHPDLLRNGCVLTASTPSAEYLKMMELSQRQFPLNNTFLMVQKSNDVMEGFFFGTRDNNPNFENCYLNNIELLKKFNRYFLQEAAPLIKRIKLDGYNMLNAKGKSFLERSPLLPLSNTDLTAKIFLKSISLLSSREQECLDLFRQGNSAQATAAKLGLSRRTVEHYFESIKNKLNCFSKWDLLNQG